MLDFLKESARLIGDMKHSCGYLFIGDTTDYDLKVGDEHTGPFNRFLHEHELEIDADCLNLVGHGVYKDGCVDAHLEAFTESIKKRHGKRVTYTFNDETCV